MVICKLCGKDVPADSKGIGETLMHVHECEHTNEMKRLGMSPEQYIAYCKKRYMM